MIALALLVDVLARSAISDSFTSIFKPLRLSTKNGEFISIIKSLVHCFGFKNALAAANTLLSLQFIKFTAEIV